MKKNIIIFLLLTINIFGFDLQLLGPVQTIHGPSVMSNLKISETTKDEFDNATIIITIKNGILYTTLSNSNLMSSTLYRSSYSISGLIGTNQIKINITEDTNELDDISLVDCYINPICDSCDIELKITIYGTHYQYKKILIFKKRKPLKHYVSYFTNKNNWWSGILIINTTEENISVYAMFYISDDKYMFTNTYSVEPKSFIIIPLFNDNKLKNKTGFIEIYIPEDIFVYTLIGDGYQSFSFQ